MCCGDLRKAGLSALEEIDTVTAFTVSSCDPMSLITTSIQRTSDAGGKQTLHVQGNTHSFKGVVFRWVSMAFRLKSGIAVSGKDTSVQAKSIAPVDVPWK